jgi:peptidoglycan/LPS O-acetylase OafA/YrhL
VGGALRELETLIKSSISKDGIYVVRALSALLVVFLHVTSLLIPQQVWIEKSGPLYLIAPWLFRGEVGVGVFIFLSGFLLSLNIPNGIKEWKGFFIRRFSRIYPVYLFVLIFAISITRQWEFNGFINAIFLFPNFPGTLWPSPYLSTAWSLGIEWTLYFLFPLLLFSIASRRFNYVLIIVFCELIILYGHFMGTDFHTLVYGSIIGRLIEFVLGMVLALNFSWIRGLSKSVFLPLVALALVIFHFWCLWYLLANGSISESYWRLFQPLAESLFAASLILISQLNYSGLFKIISKPFVFIGVISYPLYMTHMIVLDAIKNSFEREINIAIQIVFIFGLSLLLAWVVHELIEKPGMKLGRNNSHQRNV